ncbi:MAG: metal-dependent hydrolase [Candidatus Taylorbacteria bacterium CG10_big_fil_rev_8_21_14_0_10_41_48]|uniref:Metal-dependent hydrolase n=1 Tax=Candidatus Taylorbacteria bacterium CG10_big_fil_rev_8_21_14_0_10_41_48 TaxID=1975024 RepID=A0A2M8LBA3_9BACT|nr:MAG: metal-dependent hydrolase [Candidatus Taylorbacteria bacterium CG10_big_fil_rev_8_21_14_0_10_41_48]
MFFKKKIIVTHSGDFHADDAFSVAAFSILHEGKIKVIRSRKPEDWVKGDYVVDVGDVYDHAQHRYDHHQRGGAGARANGIPYAGFGLMWKHFGETVCDSLDVAERIDRSLVQSIDAGDNGFAISSPLIKFAREYPLADAIRAWRDESQTGPDAEYRDFMNAVEWAKGVLSRQIRAARVASIDMKKALDAYDNAPDKKIIVLNENIFWGEAFKSKPDTFFVVYPDSAGQWRVKTVQEEGFKSRKDLPEAWAGLIDNDLIQETNVPDAVFAHPKRFMAIAKSREGAIALAKLALER